MPERNPINQPRPESLTDYRIRSRWFIVAPLAMTAACVGASGCHDGPMYAMKQANPFFSMKQWKEDEEIGVTDHVRRQELAKLVDTIATLPPERQKFWGNQLQQILEHDTSGEMRRLAIASAAGLRDSEQSMDLIRTGLKDSVSKVRMESCRSLGKLSGEDASRTLVAVVGTDTDLDVRQAAVAALGNHKGSISTDTLRRTLEDRDPATRKLAISSLRQVTGRDYGEDPANWIAALDNKMQDASQPKSSIARLPEIFSR
jgi:HEAT repeat protein